VGLGGAKDGILGMTLINVNVGTEFGEAVVGISELGVAVGVLVHRRASQILLSMV